MIANPTIFSWTHATTTLTLGALILAAILAGVQRHRKPVSIKSRDSLASASASPWRANRNDRSELVNTALSTLFISQYGARSSSAIGTGAVQKFHRLKSF